MPPLDDHPVHPVNPDFFSLFLRFGVALCLAACLFCSDEQADEKNVTDHGPGAPNPCLTDVLGKDASEPDDSTAAAKTLNDNVPQSNNIHNCANDDFMEFAGVDAFHTAILDATSGNLEANLTLCLTDSNCPASSAVTEANGISYFAFRMSALNTYYARVRPWNNSTGGYDLTVKANNGASTTAITDTESGNDTLLGSKSIAALSADTRYTGGQLGTPATDTKDYHRVSGLTLGKVYVFAMYTAVTAARLCINLYDKDSAVPANKKIAGTIARAGNAFMVHTTDSTDDLYVEVNYCDPANILAVIDYSLLVVEP